MTRALNRPKLEKGENLYSGLVWSGLVWFGLVWSGLVWFGRLFQDPGRHEQAVRGKNRSTPVKSGQVLPCRVDAVQTEK